MFQLFTLLPVDMGKWDFFITIKTPQFIEISMTEIVKKMDEA